MRRVDCDTKSQECGEQRNEGIGDQRNHPDRSAALTKVGEHVEGGDDSNTDDQLDVAGYVAANEQENQVFAGVDGRPPLSWRMSMSCEIRSSGTGKTTTVFRSTPISVRVCK